MTAEPPGDSRGRFGSPLGAVLATAGVAIGLGNIWRFPYMMGRDGGSAFLFIYVVIVAVFGVPLLMCEWTLGRETRRGPWGAYQRAGMPMGKAIGGLLLLTVFMSAAYYGVVVAWVGEQAAVLGLAALRDVQPRPVASGDAPLWRELAWLAGTVAAGCAILAVGVKAGIERLSRIAIPAFFVLFFVVLVRVLTLDGAMDGLGAFLRPRLEDFSGRSAVSALGQAVFSLGLGGVFMVVYGSYMRDADDIPLAAVGTASADLAAALLAGLIVVPAVLVTGHDLASGPNLLFVVMPDVFARMPGGLWIGAAFFLAIFLVAMLSLIAAYEVIVAAMADGLGWTRRRALAVVATSQIILALPAYLIGRYIEISDLLWGTTMQPVGAVAAVIAVGWCIGRARTLESLQRSSRLPVPEWLYWWIKLVIPIGMIVILVFGWLDWLSIV